MANALTYQSEFTGPQMDERFTAVAQLQAALLEVETALSAKYVKPASGIPETDMDAAVQSALAKARSAVQDLSNYYTKTEIDALLSAVNSQEYVDVASLPTASASTLGKIYLVGPTNNQYDRYYTSYDGSDYSWVAAGSTEINLSNYATKAELSQLDQEVNGTPQNYTADEYLKNDGTTAQNVGWGVTDLIPYTPGNSVTWKFDNAGHGYYIGFYNADKEYISGSDFSAQYNAQVGGRLLTAAQVNQYARNAAYIRASFTLGYADAEILVGDTSVWTPQEKEPSLQEQIDTLAAQTMQGLKIKTKKDFTPLGDYYLYAPGPNYQVSSNYELYCIRAAGALHVVAKLYDTDGNQYALAFVDNSGNVITDKSIKSINGVQNIAADVPTGAKYIMICNKKSSGNGEFDIYYDSNFTEQKESSLYVGDLINSDTSGGDLANNPSYNDTRVTSHSVCAFPRQGLVVTAHLPWRIQAYIWYSPQAGSSSISSYTPYLNDGDSFSFPDTATHFRVVFRESANKALPKDNIVALIESGDIYFSYDSTDENMVIRNLDKSARVGAVKRNLTGLLDGMDSMFVFGHISDIHGDSVRFDNFANYCNVMGVDAALNSGDAVMFKAVDYNSFTKDIMARYPNVPYFFCIGNHESNPTGQTKLFADNIEPLVSTYGYLKASDTPADNCYYYKDFSEKKIRLVVLNYYNNGIYAGSLSQSQIDWFITTLSSTPAGYGVLVMLHSPEDKVVAESPYNAFYQKVRVTEYQENGFYVGDRPVMHIIDAFIAKTTYSGTYTDNGESVTISADFSGIDASTEFIAYVVGHRHEDWIGYYDHATHKQLSLGVTAGIALYGHGNNPAFANQEDLPRGGSGVCQDAFNICAIDRVHKLVKVVRIGADLTFNFERREYMEIPYAD